MKFSDLKVGYIYNTIYDPVRSGEFDRTHLSIILRKNTDGKTVIAIPLTSSPSGTLGTNFNKISLGKITTLPSSLSSNNTYAVLNQIRTLNANRFIALKEKANVIECKLDDSLFLKVFEGGIKQLIYSTSPAMKIDLLKNLLKDECFEQAKNLAYEIIKNHDLYGDKQRVQNLNKIKVLLDGIEYALDKKYIDDGVDKIFEEANNLNIENKILE